MRKVRFTHTILVPNSREQVEYADGYYDELSNVTEFSLSHEEYDNFRKEGSLFDDFDHAFGTIIDDCEEDRIESDRISEAIALVRKFMNQTGADSIAGAQTVLESLKYAEEKGAFWEIVNGAKIYESPSPQGTNQ